MESYDGLQVAVPADWGWGGAPFSDSWTDGPLACGAGRAFVVPGSDEYEFVPERTPFVGRPAMMTDACEGTRSAPEVDAVWLDAAGAEPGTERFAGTVRETRAFGDHTVTVWSSDTGLRTRVFASARVVEVDAHGCPDAPDRAALPAPGGEGRVTGMSVCLYGVQAGADTLIWSGSRGAGDAREYVAGFDRSSDTDDPKDDYPIPGSGQWVALGIHLADGSTRWDVVNLGREQILAASLTGGGTPSRIAAPYLTRTVLPWADHSPGLLAYCWGPEPRDLPAGRSLFRGMLG